MVKRKSQSNVMPNKFVVNNLGSTAEISLRENITSIEKENDDTIETLYEYDETFNVVKKGTRDEMIEAFVALKYSLGQEIALMKKQRIDEFNEEYSEYQSYVDECKLFVDSAL